MDNLKEKGIQSATDVILTGCSGMFVCTTMKIKCSSIPIIADELYCAAGGLATYIHADFVGSYFPESSNFHALADAG